MNRFVCFFVFCFLFSQDVLVDIEGKQIFSSSFYLGTPRSSWVDFDSSQQAFALDRFVKQELILHHSIVSGIGKEPEVFIKLKNRKEQLLVNA